MESSKDVLVGEHSAYLGSLAVTLGGGSRRANVGMSNDNGGEKPPHRKTKVS